MVIMDAILLLVLFGVLVWAACRLLVYLFLAPVVMYEAIRDATAKEKKRLIGAIGFCFFMFTILFWIISISG